MKTDIDELKQYQLRTNTHSMRFATIDFLHFPQLHEALTRAVKMKQVNQQTILRYALARYLRDIGALKGEV